MANNGVGGVSRIAMFCIWMPCLFAVLAASPVAAQVRVRLVVEVDTWLAPTPFEARKEFAATLNEADLEVTDDLDAPVVHILYEETAGPGIWPKLVPATNIVVSMRVEHSTGTLYESTCTVRPSLNPKNFPSATELRVRAIDDFRQHESFRLMGHRVGAILGMESSFRPLLSDKEPDTLFASMLLQSTLWSASNDDLFVRAFRAIRFNDKSLVTLAKDFLQKNLAAIQAAASQAPIATPLLAILVLEDYGDTSATHVLTDLTSHPLYGESARKALGAIKARNP